MTAIRTDPHLRQAVCDIIAQANVSCIIETGTNDGTSALAFHELVPFVVTCEINDGYSIVAQRKFKGKNICLCRGASDDILNRDLLYLIDRQNKNLLLVLDAHWNDYWPLLGELKAINAVRAKGRKLTVLVDDFIVPDRPNFVGCYGGLRAAESDGRESQLIPCGYNWPFDKELDRFPFFAYPDYDLGTMGYCIASDFDLSLGPHFRRLR